MVNRSRCRGLAALACLWSQCAAPGLTGMGKRMELTLIPVRMEDVAAVKTIQLIANGGAAQLAMAKQSPGQQPALEMAPLGGAELDPSPVAAFSGRFLVPPWSLRAEGDGSFSVVSTKPGSAISPLFIGNTRQAAETPVSGEYRRGIFAWPRFVKGDSGPASPLTAISTKEGRREIVLFERKEGQGFGAYTVLPAPCPGRPEDAVMIRAKGGYILFAKAYVPDGSGTIVNRPNARGDSPALGVLCGVELDASFHAVGEPFQPFDALRVFEFDAGVSGEGIAVFATTKGGAALALGKLAGKVFRREKLLGARSEAPLVSPTLAATGSRIWVAAIRAPLTEHMAIVWGTP